MQWWALNAPRQTLERAQVAGLRQRGVTQVVVEVEGAVVHPHGVTEDRHSLEALPEARTLVEGRFDESPDALEVEGPARRGERGGFEQSHRRDVHVHARILELQEEGVGRCETVVMGIGHGRGASGCRFYSGARRPRPENRCRIPVRDH